MIIFPGCLVKTNETSKNSRRLLRVVVVSSQPTLQQKHLDALEENDLSIVQNLLLDETNLAQIDADSSDVILVELDDKAEQQLDVLENLVEQSLVPILFNDTATTLFQQTRRSDHTWARKLAAKLHKMAAKPRVHLQTETLAPDLGENPAKKIIAEDQSIRPSTSETSMPIWVIGASLGGPIALKEFFSQLDPGLDISFLIAQHIGASHLDLFTEQLNRDTEMDIRLAVEGDTLEKGIGLVVPVEKRVVFDDEGKLKFTPTAEDCLYTPCIDSVISDAIDYIGANLNIIIFSGMGNDGEIGCRIAANTGCRIWTQDPESCVISSMPDSARNTGNVSFQGSPVSLAHKINDLYHKDSLTQEN